jgi:GTP cyclohydrolase II
MKPSSEIVISCLAKGELQTRYGLFDLSVFYDGLHEAITLSKGNLIKANNLYCRIHSECIASHIFLSVECDCVRQMQEAQKKILRAGKGLIVFLFQEGRGNGVSAHIASQIFKKKFGLSQDEAYRAVGFKSDNRNYDIVWKLLKYFHVHSIQLDSSNSKKFDSLRQSGILINAYKKFKEKST